LTTRAESPICIAKEVVMEKASDRALTMARELARAERLVETGRWEEAAPVLFSARVGLAFLEYGLRKLEEAAWKGIQSQEVGQ
jgi:hypothetical protein